MTGVPFVGRVDLAEFIKDPRTLREFEALFKLAGKRPTIRTSVNYNVSAAETGGVFIATAADVIFSLPPTEPDLWYTFVFKVPSGGTGGQVDPDAADKIMGNGFTSADGKSAINSGATDREGDCITLVSDPDGWFIKSLMGTWARQP